jgi:ferredoxin-NADP reductase
VTTPPDLYGKRAEDRFLRFLTRFTDTYTAMLRGRSTPWQRPDPVDRTLRLVVTGRRVEAEDVVTLTLAAPDGAPLPAWQPGCHLDLHLESGRRRQYSLCGDPGDRRTYRIAVRRITTEGGGSREVHDTLLEGSPVAVRGPRNAFPFVLGEHTLFLAGGIGITPILPMIREAARRGADWTFVYTGRSRESMPFLAELSTMDSGQVYVLPRNESGPAELLGYARPGGTVYVCGPRRMLDGVRDGFAGSVAKALHYERFTPAPIVDGKPFEVELAGSGTVLQVPADRSALDVVTDIRPEVAYSCRQGFCGTCKVRVLTGTPDHRDRRLTDEQRASGEMLICVSRAEAGRLVLDL